MKKGHTSIQAIFCISVNHEKGYMDENAIKAILEAGQQALANETMLLNSIVLTELDPDTNDDCDCSDMAPNSVAVKVTRLDIDKKSVNLKTFGTEDVPLKTWTQTEYHE